MNKNKLLTLIGCTLVSGTAIALFGNCIGAFISPVSKALSLSRGAFALTATISTIISALTLPLYPRLLKRIPIKFLILFCSLGCASSAIAYSFSNELWHFYLAAAINGAFINGVTMITISYILSTWYNDKLSFAIGVAFAGMGVISAISLPLIRVIISSMGFRTGYLLIAIAGVAIIFPSTLFLIKQSDTSKKEEDLHHMPFKEIFMSNQYKICAIALFLGNLSNLAIYNNTISYLTDVGYSTGSVSLVMSVALLSMTVAKPLVGLILDRIPVNKGGTIPCVAIIISGALAILSATSFGFAIALGVSLSFSATINSLVASSCAQQLFKKEAYMTVLSLLTMASYFGSAIGTPLGAFAHDITGAYTWAWVGAICCSGISLFLFFSLKKFVIGDKKS